MTWYKTGTVQVTSGSNAVVGTGTAFIANARVGDAFSGPDGNWYEVINIVSDTSLGIYPNYRGASVASGGVYVIAPMEGYVKDSADALRAATQVIGQVGTDVSTQVAAATAAATASQNSATAASASETNAASSATAANTSEDNAKISEDNAKTSETNAATSATNSSNSATASANSAAQAAASAGSVASKASSGANNDITSLSGLTTPLSVAQGGTGSSNGVPTMTGATASVDGVRGLVPIPTVADRLKVLSGAGTWVALPTGAAWGAITGTLSAQTDLQAALDLKQDSSSSALIPTSATFVNITVLGTAYTLPAGGTWAWWTVPFTNSTGGLQGPSTAGVSAGGTTIRALVSGVNYLGFAWRIS